MASSQVSSRLHFFYPIRRGLAPKTSVQQGLTPKTVRNRAELIDDEDVSGPCGVTYGMTSSGEKIGVIWEAECGNPLHRRPVKVIKTA